ncbi:MAG: hypothetical protein JWR63_1415 [Conexibacter sp.]|nr:hypothetical protein [Conexibacter sp.]
MTPDHTSREIYELMKAAPLRRLTPEQQEAEAAAQHAYDAWRREPGPDAYEVFRQAEERAAVIEGSLGWLTQRIDEGAGGHRVAEAAGR